MPDELKANFELLQAAGLGFIDYESFRSAIRGQEHLINKEIIEDICRSAESSVHGVSSPRQFLSDALNRLRSAGSREGALSAPWVLAYHSQFGKRFWREEEATDFMREVVSGCGGKEVGPDAVIEALRQIAKRSQDTGRRYQPDAAVVARKIREAQANPVIPFDPMRQSTTPSPVQYHDTMEFIRDKIREASPDHLLMWNLICGAETIHPDRVRIGISNQGCADLERWAEQELDFERPKWDTVSGGEVLGDRVEAAVRAMKDRMATPARQR